MKRPSFKVEHIIDQLPTDRAPVGTVQLHNSRIDPAGKNKEKFGRWQPVYIENRVTGSHTIRTARGGTNKPGLTKDSIVLDYDGRLDLSLNGDEPCEVWVRKASWREVTLFYYHHKDPLIRVTTRLAITSVVLGIMGFAPVLRDIVVALFSLFS